MNERPNILLLVIDCLRYDRTGLFSRLLSRLQNSVWFTNAWSTGPTSDNNFATLLTGRHPDEHGVLTQCMDTMLPTLPKELCDSGYDTFGASVVYPDGLDKGLPSFYTRGFNNWLWISWDKFFQLDPVWRVILSLEEPWFTMARPMDLHEPPGNLPYAYDESIMVLDGILSFFIRCVWEKYPNTVVVLTADHGQGLGENGIWHHREGLHWFLTHVPVIFSHPNFTNVSCRALFQHMDTTATVAGLAGLDFQTSGIDWSSYLLGSGLPADTRDEVILFALGSEKSTEFDLSELWLYRALRTYDWVLYESRRKSEVRRHLYHTLLDPNEQRNLASEPILSKHIQKLTETMGWPEVPWLQDYDEDVVLERLRAFGYAL